MTVLLFVVKPLMVVYLVRVSYLGLYRLQDRYPSEGVHGRIEFTAG